MSDPSYQLITIAEAERLDSVARSLLGRRVSRVSYRTWLEPGIWPHDGYAEPTATIHQIDDSIVIGLDDGNALEIGLVVPGFSWGIDIHLGACSQPPTYRVDIDVSSTPEWASLLSTEFEAVAAAWMRNNQGEPDTVWALRLGLSGGTSVVIALGWVDAGVLQHHPDNLVVIFDEAIARAYCPPDADCAYGQTIAD